MSTTRERYMISVDDEMFEDIENFRFNNRFNTRSDATQALIKMGLDVLKNYSGPQVEEFVQEYKKELRKNAAARWQKANDERMRRLFTPDEVSEE